MENQHAQMYVRLLHSICHYSKNALDIMEYGAGDLPQWTNNILSECRTHISDVTHFLRGQDSMGIRYGYANDHGRAYMATANLRHILNYAKECLSYVERGAGHYPAWVENKISVVAEYLDLVGHWLENEKIEGRIYGQMGVGGRGKQRRKRLRRFAGINSMMEFTPAHSRMNEVHRMATGQQNRMHHEQTGVPLGARRFGVPGYQPGQPGWAGNAGVAQIPRPGACRK